MANPNPNPNPNPSQAGQQQRQRRELFEVLQAEQMRDHSDLALRSGELDAKAKDVRDLFAQVRGRVRLRVVIK